MTGAVPLSLLIGEGIIIVLTPKINVEIGEGDAVWLLGIALRLFNLSNKT